MLGSSAPKLAAGSGILSAAFADNASASTDANVEALQASERIQKLTQATDFLVARDFALREEDAILDDMERYLLAVEEDVRLTEDKVEVLQKNTALLRSSNRRAVAGEDAKVTKLWCEYGEKMARLVRRHSAKLLEMEKALALEGSTKMTENISR